MDVESPREFLPHQKLFLETIKRYPFLSGAFGAGKTIMLCHKCIKECLENPHSMWLLASQTFPMTRDVIVKTFLEEVELLQKSFDAAGSPVELIKDFNKAELKLTFYNGSIVLFRSCDSFEKFKSLTLEGFGLDEIVDISSDVFQMLQGRLRGRHTKHPFGILTGNPGSKNHWLYGLYFEHPPSDDYQVVQTSSYDNIFLPDGYIKSMEESYDSDWIRRYLQGVWFTFEGLIFPEFDRNIHVGDYRDNVYNNYGGSLDYGFRNPSCFLLLARDGDDNVIVVSELYKTGLTFSDLVSEIEKVIAPVRGVFRSIFVDPSAPGLIEELHRVTRAKPANNDVVMGISQVKTLLKTRRLFIDRSCVNLIKELESYHYEKDNRSKEFSELPVKVHDHAVDALRYGVADPKTLRKFVMPISRDW